MANGTKTLLGERAIVTGGADSVAREIAELFVREGAQVHICDINEESLDRARREIPGLEVTLADVSDSKAVEHVFNEARNWMGDPTILINVVGVGGPRVQIEDLTTADWRTVMAANVDGMFYTIRAAVPGMKAAGHGCIVNFSSASTRTGLPLRTPYVTSKFAVEGLTRNLARELGPSNIRVNAILPGVINNARMRGIINRNAEAENKSPEQIAQRYLDFISLRTMVEPEEIAETVLFIAGPSGRHISGQLIGVCGNAEWEI
jgi:NAD(P)-dependent dehydrogenase (short-subunit alcohol dehydrogenase family)